jgi:hypothetical protein
MLAGDLGGLDSPGIPAYPVDMDITTDVTQLPKDPAKLPADAVINAAVWAALQGVQIASVYRNKTKADARRGTAESRPGDMPAEDGKLGNSPYWTVKTYRAWDASRPGKGAGAGRPVGTGRGRAVKVTLPFACPHCQEEISRESLGLDESGKLAVAAQVTPKTAVPAGRRNRALTAAGRP